MLQFRQMWLQRGSCRHVCGERFYNIGQRWPRGYTYTVLSMLAATEDINYVATLLLFHTVFWNLKTRRIAVDTCGNGKWQLS